MTHFSAANAARQKFFRELSLIGTFFVLTVTISNLVYRVFGFTLLPVFKVTFDTFHTWCNFVLNILVFSWLTYALEWLWYGLIWIFSWLLPIVPWRPQIIIPALVTDIALVSLAFTRVFQSTDLIVPRPIRAQAESRMTPKLWVEIQEAEGSFWGPVHRFVECINEWIWKGIETLTNCIRDLPKFSTFLRRLLIGLAGSVLMWGFIRLTGYIINVLAAGHLSSPIMDVRKRFFKYFGLSLLGAIAATAMFMVLNAWLAQWLEPHSPNGP